MRKGMLASCWTDGGALCFAQTDGEDDKDYTYGSLNNAYNDL
jgi:hypothetical protein